MLDLNQIRNKVLNGDVFVVMKEIPDDSIDCIITSPPYWCARNYLADGQIGLEDNPAEYIDKMVNLLAECKRVIKPTGTIWFNVGDLFYTKSGSGQGNQFADKAVELDGGTGELFNAQHNIKGKYKTNWLQHKQRLLIPYRIAIRAQDELGLILRNDICWIKKLIDWKKKESYGSAMPSSADDRLSTNSEPIFLFAKDPDYFFNLHAIRIPHKQVSIKRNEYGRSDLNKEAGGKGYAFGRGVTSGEFLHPDGQNPGDCLMFPIESTHIKHYAMFPQSLVNFCIKAGCPEFVCSSCGRPREEIYETINQDKIKEIESTKIKYDGTEEETDIRQGFSNKRIWKPAKRKLLGYKECDCKAPFIKGIVLDPFCGSGTSGIVAAKLNRDFILIDLNPDYCKLAESRIKPYLEQTRLGEY